MMQPPTAVQFGASEAEVERLAADLHETGLGCVIGTRDLPGGGMERGCLADHKAQARVLFSAMLHQHPIP